MKVLIPFAILSLGLVIINLPTSESKGLRMRVLGASAGRSSLGRSGKPWDASGRGRGFGRGGDDRWWENDDDDDHTDFESDDLPCVGLCYFMKLQRQMKVKKEDEAKYGGFPDPQAIVNRDINNDVESTEPTTTPNYYKILYSTKKPCIGICHYYKKLGLPNPYEEEEYEQNYEDEGGDPNENDEQGKKEEVSEKEKK